MTRHLKSPWSLYSISLHLTLLTKRSWSWPWMTYSDPFCSMSTGPPNPEIYLHVFQNFTMKIHGQWRTWGQSSRSHCWLSNQLIYFLFVSHQSAMPFLRCSDLQIWPWKYKGKVMAKAKIDGYNWGLVFNRYIHFSFCGDRIIMCWDIANSIFDLENSRSTWWPRSNKTNGHIWGLEFNEYVCFLFLGDRIIFG